MEKIRGEQSIAFEQPVYIRSWASMVGQKEGEGPLKDTFDQIVDDPFFGQDTWEESENEFQKETAQLAMKKANMSSQDMRYVFAGDLLPQLIGTSFGIKSLEIPWFGLYGACSTMGEALSLGAMAIDGGYAEHVLTVTSSHLGGTEKTFRYPLEYANQRPPASSWTVTGSGAAVLSRTEGEIKITGVTTGKLVDLGVTDTMNMGAAMAPAACATIYKNFRDFGIQPDHYDKIITGDLGKVGSEILLRLLKENHYDITGLHMDCGCEIYDADEQNTNAGGSGCGCCASVLCGMILNKIKNREWNRFLFVPTGTLLNTISFNEGKAMPSIAHGVVIERV